MKQSPLRNAARPFVVTAASLSVCQLALGQACHLNYNDSNTAGDMLVNSVMVNATAGGTYYETLGWNAGSNNLGAGYAGVQDTGTAHNFVVSLWDFSSTLVLDHAAWIPPGGTYGERFGGEGTGFKIINPGRNGEVWKLGSWYTIVTRSLPSGSGSIMGAWLLDQASGTWSLQGVHETPSQLRFNFGANAFLENFSGQVVTARRRMFTREGWKRTTTGIWQAFTTAAYDGPNPGANGGVSGNSFLMEMGSSVINTAGTNASFSVAKGASPAWTAGQITSVRSLPDPAHSAIRVDWSVNAATTPPIGYEVELSSDPSFPSGLTVRQSGTRPWMRSVEFNSSSLPAGPLFGRLRITDLLDRTSAWAAFSAASDVSTRSFTWASAMTWSGAQNGWGPPERDRSNGESGSADGRTIALNGVSHARGIGCHAPSQISIALDGKNDWFLADVGVDDEIPGIYGSVIFRVTVDGQLRFDSGLMNASTSTQQVAVDLMGASLLQLEVSDGGDGNAQDHADWADARLIRLGTSCLAPPGADCDGNGILDSCQIGRMSVDTTLMVDPMLASTPWATST